MQHEVILQVISCPFLKYPCLDNLTQFTIIITLLSNYTFQNSKTSKLSFLAQYLKSNFSLKIRSFFGTPCIFQSLNELHDATH